MPQRQRLYLLSHQRQHLCTPVSRVSSSTRQDPIGSASTYQVPRSCAYSCQVPKAPVLTKSLEAEPGPDGCPEAAPAPAESPDSAPVHTWSQTQLLCMPGHAVPVFFKSPEAVGEPATLQTTQQWWKAVVETVEISGHTGSKSVETYSTKAAKSSSPCTTRNTHAHQEPTGNACVCIFFKSIMCAHQDNRRSTCANQNPSQRKKEDP